MARALLTHSMGGQARKRGGRMLRIAVLLKLSLLLGAAALTACSLTPIQLPSNDSSPAASDEGLSPPPDAAAKGDVGSPAPADRWGLRDAARSDRHDDFVTAPPGDGRPLGDGLKPKDGLKPEHDAKKPPSADK